MQSDLSKCILARDFARDFFISRDKITHDNYRDTWNNSVSWLPCSGMPLHRIILMQIILPIYVKIGPGYSPIQLYLA